MKGVLIERNYVDKDYRSTYYNFYAKKGQWYRPDCVRLHFFDETVAFDSDALKLRSTMSAWPIATLASWYSALPVSRQSGGALSLQTFGTVPGGTSSPPITRCICSATV